MMATRIGAGFKLVKDANGKMRLEPDKRARLAKLDVSARLAAEHKAKTKIRYRGKRWPS